MRGVTKGLIKGIFVVFFLALLVFATIRGIRYLQDNRPNKNKMDLSKVYKANGDFASIVFEDSVLEETAFVVDGKIYLGVELAKTYVSDKVFFDYNELILSFTTPDLLVRSFIDSSEYSVNGIIYEMDEKVTVVNHSDEVFVSLNFLEQFCNYEHEYFMNPNRVLVRALGGADQIVQVTKDTEVRVAPNIKSEIVVDVVEEQTLFYLLGEGIVKDTGSIETENLETKKKGSLVMEYDSIEEWELSKWSYVMTLDGFQGFVMNKYIKELELRERPDVKYEYDYTYISMEESVRLVWHQVTNMAANDSIEGMLDGTQGINVVSPTWFTLKDAEGRIESLASQKYVETVKSKGLQVWGLVTNQFDRNLTKELLQYTSRRDAFVEELVTLALEYNLDGINIDFESFSNTEGEAFTQLIRELSIQCRQHHLVLSVDVYVPSAWNLFINRSVIAEVADYIIVMGYDEHWGGGPESGSVSSIGFFEKGLYDTIELAPANKVIMGLPFYTRLWEEVDNQIVSYPAYGMERARRILEENAIEPIWDAESGQFYAEYVIGDSTFKMWLEDQSSIEERMKIIKEAHIAGLAAWKLGLESKAVWSVIESYNK